MAHTNFDGYEAVVPVWTIRTAANHARNADLQNGGTAQDAWSVNFVAPLSQAGRELRVVLSAARAGAPSVPARVILTLSPLGDLAPVENGT